MKVVTGEWRKPRNVSIGGGDDDVGGGSSSSASGCRSISNCSSSSRPRSRISEI